MSAFRIEFNWLAQDSYPLIESGMLAEIAIFAGERNPTEVEDLIARTVRPYIRVSANALANWFAANWWRLRWEPENKSASWPLSHKLGAVGGGYYWPNLTFVSDGEAVLLQANPLPSAPEQLVRYLNSFSDVVVSASCFEQGIDRFVEGVIGRLTTAGLATADLVGLWDDVCEERRTPELSAWRKLEAIMGFDPDEAPEELITQLQDEARKSGTGAVEEVAAEDSGNALRNIGVLLTDSCRNAPTLHIPKLDTLRQRIETELKPTHFAWQKATAAARLARETWAVGTGPVSTHALADLFSADAESIEKPGSQSGPISAGFRNGKPDQFGFFLKSPIPVSRRFAMLRLVGDHLTAHLEDKFLPSVNVKTQRQKFQRAFAQEFLCPYQSLIEYLGDEEPGDDDIEGAARHFEVSSMMVKTILVNKGRFDRAILVE